MADRMVGFLTRPQAWVLALSLGACGPTSNAGDTPCEPLATHELEYYARVDGEEQVVVVRPRDDWDYDDFRLFLGALSELTERDVYQVLRARDGGSTTIDFDYDGDEATLDFPYVDMEPGPAKLDVGGSSQSIEWLDAASFDEGGASFLCFE